MEDVYLEYLIKKKKDGKQIAIVAVVSVLAAVISLALFYFMFALAYASSMAGAPFGSFIFGIGLVLVAFAWYGAYLVITMQNIEFEYILTNSELDIDKILSKKGRKSFASFDFKDVTVCASIDDEAHAHEYNTLIDKTYDAVGDYSRGGVYFADYTENGDRIRVLFQPTYKMISTAKRFNMRNIFVKED